MLHKLLLASACVLLVVGCSKQSVPAPGKAGTLAVINVGKLPPSAGIPGTPAVEGAEAAYRYVIEAARFTMKGDADALVTAPINKEWLNRAGHHFPGHSELLARLAHVRRWRMMFAGETLRIALATVHMGLAQVSQALTRNTVLTTITLLDEHLRKKREEGVSDEPIASL